MMGIDGRSTESLWRAEPVYLLHRRANAARCPSVYRKSGVLLVLYRLSSCHEWVGIGRCFVGDQMSHRRILPSTGFENFGTKNELEQLLINFTNESLQDTFNKQVFENEIKLYEEEGIDVVVSTCPDNAECLKMLSSMPCGIIPRCVQPRGMLLSCFSSPLELQPRCRVIDPAPSFSCHCERTTSILRIFPRLLPFAWHLVDREQLG